MATFRSESEGRMHRQSPSSNIPFGRQGVPPTCVARTHGATDAGSDETAAEDGAGTSEVGRQRIGGHALKVHDSPGSGMGRVEDSSHRDDVMVDARGFHDTEATSGPH